MKNLLFLAALAASILCSSVRATEPGLPPVFLSAFDEVKANTTVPILLPTKLPRPFSDAKYASVSKATADEYAVILYYQLGVGDAGFAASFEGKNNASYSPRELSNVQAVKLAGGITGYFRPVSCGGSCAPANLWWKRAATLYAVQLRFSSTLAAKKQRDVIVQVANAAILAGPR